jgi:hypothetical protein
MEGLPTTQRGDYAIQTGWHASLLARLTCLRTTWHGLLARDPVAARERQHRAREVDCLLRPARALRVPGKQLHRDGGWLPLRRLPVDDDVVADAR